MAPQDSFIDEDEDTCPLCVEEFDLSDKNFQPCPCGYQICQFCFNNIKNNINGLCPACRRPYDEKTIKWKVVTPEEVAQFKANVQKNAKKKAEQRQKEAQKREVESLNRKHLSGLRVVQKNLVYVVGLSPSIREEEILQTLRGDKYFGQYGKIIKIVVSKSKQNESAQNAGSLGVYVTFARKEDAARCIAAVNGSQNGDRVLRAQLGTTKYCSAYLRNEVCTNKQCMFLHEPGDNDDSYSRQDLSSINSVNSQRPLPAMASSSRQAAQAAPPIQQAQPVAAATQPMVREASKDGSDSGDGSALPSSASWANRGIQRSRRGSHATSVAASSPAISTVIPATAEAVEEETPELVQDQQESVGDVSPVEVPEEASSDPLSYPDYLSLGAQLLKSINSDVLSYNGNKRMMEEFASFPPLFDDRGGEKRRLAREQQEEDRIQMEQESQTDLRSVPEPVEEEEPESGSLQLGGEPEDNVREINQPPGFSRRPSAQLPIQRGSNAGPFGPSLGQSYTQNIGNLGSVNGRSLTPMQQSQLQILKSGQIPSSFITGDHMPPGIGNPLNQNAALFQQQGHNRQSSRYSFANENGSASSSVKPSANPKMMAQQASMMPPTSHAQQASQFYGSSMPGPPPGLKSSGTPPIGGGMFGHGFGNSMGGNSVFGGSSKDSNNNDMLRDMLNRNRGGAGGNQAIDTAKREYMFPNFLHQQFPSASSTPAPASGLLASLYGPQTGAFHDFGQKQKKKGKKHRHANTSSSGGGGLVDLADPSILQARMQHQQQSNAGVGQGLFGGQAQEDNQPGEVFLPFNVDALVSDSEPLYDMISRSSTPSFPPGLAPPHGHPSPAVRDDPIGKPAAKMFPASTPFTPSRNPSSTVPRIATPLANVSVPTTPTPVKSKVVPDTPLPAKQIVQEVPKATKPPTPIVSQSAVTPAATPAVQKSFQSEEDFPALGKVKDTRPAIVKTLPKASTPVSKATTATPKASNATKNQNKKGKGKTLDLSIPTVTKAAPEAADAAPDTPSKVSTASSALPSSKSAQAPAIQTSSKSLRIVSTPKADVPAAIATPASASTTTSFPPGRQFSLTGSEILDTPVEPISDNASIISTSMSRASSPAPSRAPKLNTAQKNKHKKEQKEKGLEAQMKAAAAAKMTNEEQAPISSRKTKQKKEKTVNNTAGSSTPADTRPSTPAIAPTPTEDNKPPTSTVEDIPEQPTTLPEKKASKNDSKTKNKSKTQQQPVVSEPVPQTATVEDEIPEKSRIPSPASIFQQLNSESALPCAPQDLALFNMPAAVGTEKRKDFGAIDLKQPAIAKLTITQNDRIELNAGRPVHKISHAQGDVRILLTPNGDCIRGLTEAQEQYFLKLQKTIGKDSGPTAFMSEKHKAGSGFSLVSGRAVPNGPPSFFPTTIDSNTIHDPVSKIQHGEALGYVNQYVIPSLPNSTQLDKAFDDNVDLLADFPRGGSPIGWPTICDDTTHDIRDNVYGHPESLFGSSYDQMRPNMSEIRDRDNPISNVQLLDVEVAATAVIEAKKTQEAVDKRLAALIKKNSKLILQY